MALKGSEPVLRIFEAEKRINARAAEHRIFATITTRNFAHQYFKRANQTVVRCCSLSKQSTGRFFVASLAPSVKHAGRIDLMAYLIKRHHAIAREQYQCNLI